MAKLCRLPSFPPAPHQARATKPQIRAVCAVLDNFHFQLPHDIDPAEAAAAAAYKPPTATPAAAPAAAPATAAGKDATAAGDQKDQADQQEEEDEEEEEEDEEADAEAAAASAAYDAMAQARDVQRALRTRVLPSLRSQLIQHSEVVRAPVALAMVKLIKLLPPEAERMELPKVLQGICNLLADRQQRVRDDARHVLVAVAKELGPGYMPYICTVLR